MWYCEHTGIVSLCTVHDHENVLHPWLLSTNCLYHPQLEQMSLVLGICPPRGTVTLAKKQGSRP
jgi:hypothetical protein